MAGELCANFASHILFEWWVFLKKKLFLLLSDMFPRVPIGFFIFFIFQAKDREDNKNIWAIER